MKRHYVIFFSPGTFMAEETEKEINKWDIEAAKTTSKEIQERYGAVPYGFVFVTRKRKRNEMYPKTIKTSNMYYLGGKIETLEEIKLRNNSEDKTLISNMECNGYDKVVVNTNSWKWTMPLKKDDIILEM
jgi:hypothetical protein